MFPCAAAGRSIVSTYVFVHNGDKTLTTGKKEQEPANAGQAAASDKSTWNKVLDADQIRRSVI
ncbi:MAG TPA: hypothetical protein PLP17_05655, partial [Oligoflexia bacterium]|nr:hypothetical protein [Oligoflexia bacterium]